MSAFIRTAAQLRRRSPALALASGVMLGQTGMWWATDLVTLLWALAALTILIPLLVEPVRSGLILGVISSLLVAPEPALPPIAAADASVLAELTEPPKRGRVGSLSLTLRPIDGGQSIIKCRAVDLPWRNASRLTTGDVVWVRGSFKPVLRPVHPFSWEGYLYRQGVTSECKALFVSEPISRTPEPLTRVRESVTLTTLTAVGDSQATGLFLSMAFGYEGLMSDALERAFKVTGLIHLLVVSGYQVTMVCALAAMGSGLLFARIASGGSARKLAAIPGLLLGGLYVAVCGCEPSSVRALLASACLAVHQFDDHSVRFMQRCGVALVMLALIWPWCFFDLGVQLTFAALLGIALGTRGRKRSWLRSAVAVSVYVWCTTGIVCALWGGTLSLLSVPLNVVLAGPWSCLNCCVGAFGLLVYTLGLDSGALVLGLVTAINDLITKAVVWAAQYEFIQLECKTWELKAAVTSAFMVLLLPGIVRLRRTAVLDPRL